MTKPENLTDHISSIAAKDWELLFELLPQINQTKRFGKLVGSCSLPNGSVSLPYWSEEEVVSKFFNATYFLGIVMVFDWSAWKEGMEILNDPDTDYSKLDMATLCMLITTIVRADKFCEGYMINCFETGIISKIVESMQCQVLQAA